MTFSLRSARGALLLLGLASALAGCSGGGKKNVAVTTATTASITGNVCDAGSLDNTGGVLTCSGIQSVKVTVNDVDAGTSNEQGFFNVASAPVGDRVSVCFTADGFVTRCRNVAVRAGQAVRLSPTELLPAAPAVTLPAASGTVTDGGAAEVIIAAGDICQLDRTTPVSGAITCTATPLDATSNVQRALAPGSYLGTTGAGAPVQLATGGMLDITCVLQGTTTRVDVCSGKSVDVKIPITTSCADDALFPSPMDSWGFDTATGLWVREASFTKTCAGDAGHYAGVATHFSYWNADQVIESTCLRGTILSAASVPVEGARIVCEGVDYQGSAEAFSAADGTFCVAAKTGGQVRCSADKGGFATAGFTATLTAPATTAVCGSPACQAIGPLQLSDPLLQSVLTWGEDPSDLDSYWVPQDYATSGWFVWYGDQGSLSEAPLVNLDTDDTSSFGPEITTVMPALGAGRYRFCVHNYSSESGGPIAASGARVQLTGAAVDQTFAVPTANPGGHRVWRVYEATIAAGGAVTVTPLNDFRGGTTGSGSGVAQACWGE